MSVISTGIVSAGREPANCPPKSRTHKAGIGISVLVVAFLVFDAAGKLAGVPQVKEGTRRSGSRPGRRWSWASC